MFCLLRVAGLVNKTTRPGARQGCSLPIYLSGPGFLVADAFVLRDCVTLQCRRFVRAFGQHVVAGDVVTNVGETTINGLLPIILITRRTVSPSWRAQCSP